MRAILLAASLLLTGCGTTYQVRVDADQAPLDPAVAERCDPVLQAPVPNAKGEIPMGDLYQFANDMVGLYGECATRDAGKYDWIKSQGH